MISGPTIMYELESIAPVFMLMNIFICLITFWHAVPAHVVVRLWDVNGPVEAVFESNIWMVGLDKAVRKFDMESKGFWDKIDAFFT